MNLQNHWGEFEDATKTNYVPDVSADIEKSMNKFCLADLDSEQEEDENASELVLLQPMDPLILYSIALHKHTNYMTETIRTGELAVESNLIPPNDIVPPIPDKPVHVKNYSRNCLNFIPKDPTPFTQGEETAYPEISGAIAKQVLTKSVATLFAHIGYETTQNTTLLLLTDVLEAFLKKICRRFKSARDEERAEGTGGFPSYPEKVLTELGLGGMKGLHDYYYNRVIKYTDVLRKRCDELDNHYGSLLIPKSPSPTDDNKVIELDLGDGKIMSTCIEGEFEMGSLEPGFQLLNSLEAETTGYTEDDMSPGISTDTEATLSPFSKKKRSK